MGFHMHPSAYFTAKQLCERYKLSMSTVYAALKRGELPQPQRFGRSVRWSVDSIEAFDARRAAQAQA